MSDTLDCWLKKFYRQDELFELTEKLLSNDVNNCAKFFRYNLQSRRIGMEDTCDEPLFSNIDMVSSAGAMQLVKMTLVITTPITHRFQILQTSALFTHSRNIFCFILFRGFKLCFSLRTRNCFFLGLNFGSSDDCQAHRAARQLRAGLCNNIGSK